MLWHLGSGTVEAIQLEVNEKEHCEGLQLKKRASSDVSVSPLRMKQRALCIESSQP